MAKLGEAAQELLQILGELESALRKAQKTPGFEEYARTNMSGTTNLLSFVEEALTAIGIIKAYIIAGPSEEREFTNLTVWIKSFLEKFPEGSPVYETNHQHIYAIQIALLECFQKLYDLNLLEKYIKEIWSDIPWKRIAAFIKEEFQDPGAPSSAANAVSPETRKAEDNEERDWGTWLLETIEKTNETLLGTVLMTVRSLVLDKIKPGLLSTIEDLASVLRQSKYTARYIGELDATHQQTVTWGAKSEDFKSSCLFIGVNIEGNPSNFLERIQILSKILKSHQDALDVLVSFPKKLIGIQYIKELEKQNDSMVAVENFHSWYFIDKDVRPAIVDKKTKKQIDLSDGHQTESQLIKILYETEDDIIKYIIEKIFPEIAKIAGRLQEQDSEETPKLILLNTLHADVQSLMQLIANNAVQSSLLTRALQKSPINGISDSQKLLRWLLERKAEIEKQGFIAYQEQYGTDDLFAAAYPTHAVFELKIDALKAEIDHKDTTSERLQATIEHVQAIQYSEFSEDAIDQIISDKTTGIELSFNAPLRELIITSCTERAQREWSMLDRTAKLHIKIAQAKIASMEMFKKIQKPEVLEQERVSTIAELESLKKQKAALIANRIIVL